MAPGTPSPLRLAPIEAIWIAAAREIGWRVERTSEAFATNDGDRTIAIGVDAVLDVDDAAAQLIFHELCHGIVQGPGQWSQRDWGLSNADDRDVIAEHACLRMQIHLASPHGLRHAMAPTTEYRAYHDAVSGDPLEPRSDPAAARAREALERPESARWIAALSGALARTRVVLEGHDAPDEKGGADFDTARIAAADPRHPVGFAWGPASETCGSCAWLYVGGRGPGVERCRQAVDAAPEGQRTARAHRACVRWEPPVACQSCGACCREAYHSVTVSVRDPVVWKQPALIVRQGHRFEILREGPRCAALSDRREPRSESVKADADVAAKPSSSPTFACTIYEDRPRACRDFEAGGRHCLVARRRVGLSV